jgi:glycosyltransferase involved in cell wall biosynthesis
MENRHIVHIISSLDVGGAQRMLLRLLAGLEKKGWSNEVLSLTDSGSMKARFEGIGVTVTTVPRSPSATYAWRLGAKLRSVTAKRPAIIQTWMYHADFVGIFLKATTHGVPIIWGIRSNAVQSSTTKWRTRIIARACASASKWAPTRIVSCSNSAAAAHAKIGYGVGRMRTIPNGFDTDAFRPIEDPVLRRSLGLGHAPLIGMAARYHPVKDHATFFAAARIVAAKLPNAHFVLCGTGVDDGNAALRAMIKENGIEGRTHLMGEREGLADFFSSLDVSVLTSTSEAFPNVVAESMACGTPCVATDVGDAAEIVGDPMLTAAPGDAEDIAGRLIRTLTIGEADRAVLRRSVRDRIVRLYSLTAVVNSFEDLYTEVIAECAE